MNLLRDILAGIRCGIERYKQRRDWRRRGVWFEESPDWHNQF